MSPSRFGLSAISAMLMTEHNLYFYQQLMADLRSAISERRLSAFSRAFRATYRGDNGAAGC